MLKPLNLRLNRRSGKRQGDGPGSLLRWVDLADIAREHGLITEGEERPGSGRLREWSLVLRARSVPHREKGFSRDGFRVLVPAQSAGWAARELVLYEKENAQEESRPEWLQAPKVGLGVLSPVMALLAFYVFSSYPWPEWGFYPEFWDDHGAAVAGRIVSGEWWRAVTSLTLHADPAHVLGNAAVGGVFAVCVARELGTGLGWLSILAAGMAGNVANALYQDPGHISVGFSTAVFGAAGLLAGFRAGFGSLASFRFSMAPIAAGLGLLALLGMSGERTDIGSHVFGFFCGAVLGLSLGRLFQGRSLPGRLSDGLLFLVAWTVPAAAWFLAYHPPGLGG